MPRLGGDAGAGEDHDLLRVAQPPGNFVETELVVHRRDVKA